MLKAFRQNKRRKRNLSAKNYLDKVFFATLVLFTVATFCKWWPRNLRKSSTPDDTSRLRAEGQPQQTGPRGAPSQRRPQPKARRRPSRPKAEALPERSNLSGSLPTLEGLEVHPTSGRRPLPRAELFVHQGNYNKLMEHYAARGALLIHNNRSFPTPDMRILRRYNFTSCAVVGNSGSLLNSSFGTAIDSHNIVLRINQAPPGLDNNRYKRHVGLRTTFRLINTRWTGKYGITYYVDEGRLPLEQSVTVIVTRARPHLYDSFVQTLKKARSDVSVLYLSSRVVGAAHRLLTGYRGRLNSSGVGPFEGGDTPSSGFLAVYLMMQACKSVTVYGFGLDDESGKAQEYHYFHVFSPKHSKKKNSMNPTHSFNTERAVLRALSQQGHLTLCGYAPGGGRHNRRCGTQRGSGARGPRGSAVLERDSFAELGLAGKPRRADKVFDR